MQILHIIIAIIMLIMAAYYTWLSIAGIFIQEAKLELHIASSVAAASLALAALYVLHW